jgi:hypothetical protein
MTERESLVLSRTDFDALAGYAPIVCFRSFHSSLASELEDLILIYQAFT